MAKIKKASKGSSAKNKTRPAKKPVKKGAPARKKVVKKGPVRTAKKVVKKAAASKKPVTKSVARKGPKKTGSQPKKSAGVKKSKPSVQNTHSRQKQAAVKTAPSRSAPSKTAPSKPVPSRAVTSKQVPSKGKQMQQPATKSKPTAEEKLHSKAQRIIKELEETMDMSKVKPRIKVPVYNPAKLKPPPVVKLPEPTDTDKEKYQLEFEFRSSKAILFSYLSDSSGLAGWFADEVRSQDDNYVFVWEGSEVHAKQVAVKDQHIVRYQWTDENDGTYFQFEIKEDDITSDIALLITDWAVEDEKDTNRMLWENQVQRLRQLLGSM